MLRVLLFWLSRSQRMRDWMTHSRLGRRVSRRFVAGETLEEGIEVARGLQERGFLVTLAHLGEWVHTEEDARRAAEDIRRLIQAVGQAEVRAYVSLKLSHLGIHIAQALARELLRELLEVAREWDMLLRVDMEESALVEPTLDLHRTLWDEGYTHLGLVLQSYLYRSEGDLRRLLQMYVPVRLVKGAYKEPATVAFRRKRDVNANFDRMTRMLLEAATSPEAPRLSANGRKPPLAAIASHDWDRIAYALEYAQRLGLPKEALEFQMLYGIRRDLQERLRDMGYPVRIYVPFGQEWYPYFMRRLAERPANLFFFLRHVLRP